MAASQAVTSIKGRMLGGCQLRSGVGPHGQSCRDRDGSAGENSIHLIGQRGHSQQLPHWSQGGGGRGGGQSTAPTLITRWWGEEGQ